MRTKRSQGLRSLREARNSSSSVSFFLATFSSLICSSRATERLPKQQRRKRKQTTQVIQPSPSRSISRKRRAMRSGGACMPMQSRAWLRVLPNSSWFMMRSAPFEQNFFRCSRWMAISPKCCSTQKLVISSKVMMLLLSLSQRKTLAVRQCRSSGLDFSSSVIAFSISALLNSSSWSASYVTSSSYIRARTFLAKVRSEKLNWLLTALLGFTSGFFSKGSEGSRSSSSSSTQYSSPKQRTTQRKFLTQRRYCQQEMRPSWSVSILSKIFQRMLLRKRSRRRKEKELERTRTNSSRVRVRLDSGGLFLAKRCRPSSATRQMKQMAKGQNSMLRKWCLSSPRQMKVISSSLMLPTIATTSALNSASEAARHRPCTQASQSFRRLSQMQRRSLLNRSVPCWSCPSTFGRSSDLGTLQLAGRQTYFSMNLKYSTQVISLSSSTSISVKIWWAVGASSSTSRKRQARLTRALNSGRVILRSAPCDISPLRWTFCRLISPQWRLKRKLAISVQEAVPLPSTSSRNRFFMTQSRSPLSSSPSTSTMNSSTRGMAISPVLSAYLSQGTFSRSHSRSRFTSAAFCILC